jgi:hypothetical protein
MKKGRVRKLALVVMLQLVPFTLLSGTVTGCATMSDKPAKKQVAKKKPEKQKNFSLYRNKDLNWKVLKRGQKEMGGSAFDSY